ncbi:MAG TPA: ATP-binding cassette domain-containing protein, partial [Candidatus Eisenbacteria bacterium]|nr:ATP-binding cassette domain-containing protein [Candidatus Eisenbacteria bacterium]
MGDKDVGLKDAGLKIGGLTLAEGGRWAVKKFDLSVPAGAVHVILGERDTGKTALLESIAGLRVEEAGSIRFADAESSGKAGAAERRRASALLPREVPPSALRVSERLSLHAAPRWIGIGLHVKQAEEQARARAAALGLEALLEVPLEALRPLERRLVELAAALAESPAVLLLDEPTGDLGPHEARQYLAVLRGAAERAKIPAVVTTTWPRDAYPDARAVTILWRGAEPATLSTSDVTEAALVERWTGGVGIRRTPSGAHTAGDMLLRAEGLVLQGRGRETSLAGLSFEVNAGEVLAICGAPADGLNLLHDILLGSRTPSRGTMHFLGKDIARAPRRLRVDSGMTFVNPPHARDQSILDFTVDENLALGQMQGLPFARGGFLRHESIRGNAVRALLDFDIPETVPETRFGDLGLGMRQRLIVAREVIHNPRLLVIRSPGQGLSLEAQEYVRRTLILQCERGTALLWLTDEPEEAMRVADRLAVLTAGKLVWIPV